MLGAIDAGLQSIQAGFDRLDRVAERVAKDTGAAVLGDNIIEMMRARHEVRVGAAVVRTADDAIGSLLDVLA